MYKIVVDACPKDEFNTGWEEEMSVKHDAVERAWLLTLFGNVAVLDSSGLIVYAADYRKVS